MLTLFAIPKPFTGEVGGLQRNALRRWQRLGEGVSVILLGDEVGVAETAADFGVSHIPSVAVNEFGTPLLDSAFELAQRHSRDPLMGYANADLILYPDLLDAARVVSALSKRFMLVGRCYDLQVAPDLDDVALQATHDRDDGEMRSEKQIDYMIFPRGSLPSLPSFAVGRPAWDAWMIWQARRLRMDVVDLTPSVRVVHQHHDYNHLSGNRSDGPEAAANRALLRYGQRFSIRDATHKLEERRLVANRRDLRRRVRTELLMHDSTVRLARLLPRS